MWDIKKWHNRIFCIHCNWSKRASHGSMFHSVNGLTGCCPGCGAEIEEWRMTPIWKKPFIMKTVRWIPDLRKRKWLPGFKELSTGRWEERKSEMS